MLKTNPHSATHVYCNRPLGYRATDNMPEHFRVHRMEDVMDDVNDDVAVGMGVDNGDVLAMAMDVDTLEDALRPLWEHQNDALTALRASDFAIGTLAMPCGSGKTRVMMEWEATVGGRTVVISPTRKLARQTFGRIVDPMAMRLLVDSDASTDANAAATVWDANERCVISTTLKSWNAVVRHLQPPPDALIFDEAHHVRTTDLHDDADKTLLVSATPNQHVDDDGDGDELSSSSDDVKPLAYATAPTIFHLPIAYAIDHHIIADYRLYLPILQSGYASDPAARATFLADALFRIKVSHRVIVFGSSWEDVYATLDAIKRMHAIDMATALANDDAPPVDLWTGSYTASLKAKERTTMEDEFQTFDGIALLGSVDILREGADLPACDGVFIMDVSSNATRFVQAMMRSMRRSSPTKVASVFLWLPDKDDVPNALRRLHVEDPSFARKIRGLDPRVLEGTDGAIQDQWASLEPQWDTDVMEAIRVRAVRASEKMMAKARFLCDEYATRKTWTYKYEERFPAELGGGRKRTFVKNTRSHGRPGGSGVRPDVRAVFVAADPTFFDAVPEHTTIDERADALIAYRVEHGKDPPRSDSLGMWLNKIRTITTSISDDVRARLEAGGVRTVAVSRRVQTPEALAWNALNTDEKVNAVIAYKREHGGADPPQSTQEGKWLNGIRSGNVRLTDAQRAGLESAGVRTVGTSRQSQNPEALAWNALNTDEKVNAIIAYKRAHGGADPPRSTQEGKWLNRVRGRMVRSITDIQRARLVEAGVDVTPYNKRKRDT
jgi:superfamily II DNA or RNA helicase